VEVEFPACRGQGSQVLPQALTPKPQALKVISFYFIVFKSQVLNRFAQDIDDMGRSENDHPKHPPIP
jgi:hypothetical protein